MGIVTHGRTPEVQSMRHAIAPVGIRLNGSTDMQHGHQGRRPKPKHINVETGEAAPSVRL